MSYRISICHKTAVRAWPRRIGNGFGYVLCTNDADYVELATTSIEHAGIVFGQQHKHGIREWVRFLELLASVLDPEEMVNRVEYLS